MLRTRNICADQALHPQNLRQISRESGAILRGLGGDNEVIDIHLVLSCIRFRSISHVREWEVFQAVQSVYELQAVQSAVATYMRAWYYSRS